MFSFYFIFLLFQVNREKSPAGKQQNKIWNQYNVSGKEFIFREIMHPDSKWAESETICLEHFEFIQLLLGNSFCIDQGHEGKPQSPDA